MPRPPGSLAFRHACHSPLVERHVESEPLHATYRCVARRRALSPGRRSPGARHTGNHVRLHRLRSRDVLREGRHRVVLQAAPRRKGRSHPSQLHGERTMPGRHRSACRRPTEGGHACKTLRRRGPQHSPHRSMRTVPSTPDRAHQNTEPGDGEATGASVHSKLVCASTTSVLLWGEWKLTTAVPARRPSRDAGRNTEADRDETSRLKQKSLPADAERLCPRGGGGI